MKITEDRFNSIVAACQWSSSWFIAAAVLVTLLGVHPPEVIVTGFIWLVSAAAPLFLTVGMYQCWRLPDGRRYLAIPASAFLIFSAVLMFGSAVENNRADEYQNALAMVHDSASWKNAEAEYEAALSDYRTLAEREFTQQFATQFALNQQAKNSEMGRGPGQGKAVSGLEPAMVKSAGSPFDAFGKEWAWLVFSIFLALYSVVNEAIAMALSHRRKEKSRQHEKHPLESKPDAFDRVPTFEEYIEVAKRLGQNGKIGGAEAVSKETGWKLHICKAIVKKAIEDGKVRMTPGSNRPEEAKP